MTFATDQQNEDDLSNYKELVRNAASINSQLAAWVGKYTALRASVDAPRQAELDAKHTVFIDQLKLTLGL